MSVHVESNIEFDFTKANSVIAYENLLQGRPGASPSQANTFWPGVDFCIEDTPHNLIWLEVKNWNPTSIPPKDRGGSRWSFICKMRSKPYAQEMREKFLGTSSFFVWDSLPWPANVHFILLLEPPHPLDAALVLTFSHRVRQRIMPPRILGWRNRITVSAMTLTEWNLRFPDYPAVQQ